MTTELVGPVPSVRFHDGTKVAYRVPRDTMDPRYRPCRDHHVACDCREAELAEQIQELRAQLEEVRAVAREVLAGHPTFAYERGVTRDREVGCACTGCRIVRRSWLLNAAENGPSARDEIDGLSPTQIECGYRWEACFPRTGETCPAGDGVYTRQGGHRGPFHEHLRHASGGLVERIDWTECPF